MSFYLCIYFFSLPLKDRSVRERLQPSLVAISQDLKEKFNKGTYRFFCIIFIVVVLCHIKIIINFSDVFGFGFAQRPNADVFVPDVGVKRTSEEKQRPGETSTPLNMERKYSKHLVPLNNLSVDPPSLPVLLICGVIEQILQNKTKLQFSLSHFTHMTVPQGKSPLLIYTNSNKSRHLTYPSSQSRLRTSTRR